MASKANVKSDATEAIHSAADGLYRAGTIDTTTMRAFDTKIRHVTKAGANLFRDLGFSATEAKKPRSQEAKKPRSL
jgi:DNA-binding transcriptional regulator YiaG